MALGFNCGEAANIATPEWLNIAKAAAIRRASINYPPMVSHFQLLYDLAIALHSRYALYRFLTFILPTLLAVFFYYFCHCPSVCILPSLIDLIQT